MASLTWRRRAGKPEVRPQELDGTACDNAAEKGDYSVANELHEMLKAPYDEQPEHEGQWYQKRPEG